ncbi:MAG: NAD-dependent epimerase/dehydratase family protein [Candidatus Microthrix subdominans]
MQQTNSPRHDQHVLVTGGAGFIGSNLAERLVDDKRVVRVIVLDDLSTGRRDNLEGVGGPDTTVDLVEGSVLDEALVTRLVAEATAVVHLAAIPSVPRSVDLPRPSMTTNVDGTVNVLEAIRSAGGRPLVFASSSSVYGAADVLPKTIDLAPAPLSPYAVSKLAGESAVLAWRHCYGFPAVPFRFFNVYGPRQRAGDAYAAAIPAFLDAALAGRPIPVNGDGMQSRDFTYVGDVTDVLAEVALGGMDSARPVNLAFGRRWTLLDVIAELETLFGRSLEVAFGPDRPGDVPHSQADPSGLEALMGPRQAVDLADGLGRTARWWGAEGTDSSGAAALQAS